MPKPMGRRLKAKAKKRGLKGETYDRFMCGTMCKSGREPKRKRK